VSEVKELAVIMAKDCPHCQQLFSESETFRNLSKRVLVRVYDIQDELLIHEATALYVGITERERLLWGAGAPRGTLKTPSFIVWDLSRGVLRADVAPQGEFQVWLTVNTMLAEIGEPRLPPPRASARKERRKERKKEGGKE
jgi:hypothetical protein